MKSKLRIAFALTALAIAGQAMANVRLFENEKFGGRSFFSNSSIRDMGSTGFNNRASSIGITNERWEVCDAPNFQGRCVVLRPGWYPSLAAMGLSDRVSSLRELSPGVRVTDDRYTPLPPPVINYQRRSGERLYEAQVVAVRAIVGPPEQRCWIDRDAVPQDQRDANVPGAIAGALIGGIIGHQIGEGSGRDVATIGGVLAGAAIGSRVDDNRGGPSVDVRRCEVVAGHGRPQFWHVVYVFRGQQYRVQMIRPPGPTLTVNGRGEPRE